MSIAATCGRVETANRIALLLDSEAYFAAAAEALRGARRSVLLIGWNFDPRTRLHPGDESAPEPDAVGPLLNALAAERPELDIRVLIWDMAWPIAFTHGFFPQRATGWFRGSRVRFHLDDTVPPGGCHHQKILVIDDRIAFCGGGDFGLGRWDTPAHRENDPRRRNPSGAAYPPRHEVMMVVDGAAAAALGDIARNRWRRATGEVLDPTNGRSGPDQWPRGLPFDLTDVPVTIACTEPAWKEAAGARECEALYLAAIAAAKQVIYLENQYFTSQVIGEALAARLREPGGPEVLIVCTLHSPGHLDRLCMDAARDGLVAWLRGEDRHGRFHVLGPRTTAGNPVIVHSKLAVIDDWFLRVGSSNLNNRSMGVDTECDLATDVRGSAGAAAARAAILTLRNGLIGHYLGRGEPAVTAAVAERGSLNAAIEALDSGPLRRLAPHASGPLGPLKALIAKYHIGDPEHAGQTWRPWRRVSGAERQFGAATRKSITSGR